MVSTSYLTVTLGKEKQNGRKEEGNYDEQGNCGGA
jgi:hypothetical protein